MRPEVGPQGIDVEERHPAVGGHHHHQVVRVAHLAQHVEVLLGQRLGGERGVEQPLLLGLEPRHLDAVPLGLDLLFLGDLVVDRRHHLGRRLEIAEEERRDLGDAHHRPAVAGAGDQRRVDEAFHRLIAQIDRLEQQSGGFGAYLVTATDWANTAAQHKSYELISRYVMPKFQDGNAWTVRSMNWVSENRTPFLSAATQGVMEAINQDRERRDKAAS